MHYLNIYQRLIHTKHSYLYLSHTHFILLSTGNIICELLLYQVLYSAAFSKIYTLPFLAKQLYYTFSLYLYLLRSRLFVIYVYNANL